MSDGKGSQKSGRRSDKIPPQSALYRYLDASVAFQSGTCGGIELFKQANCVCRYAEPLTRKAELFLSRRFDADMSYIRVENIGNIFPHF